MAVVRNVKTQAGVMPAGTERTQIIGEVFSSMHGFLYCVTCHGGWCNHVETVIKEGLDSKSIWNDFTWHDQTRLVVPILPNDWFLFGEVLLVPNGDDFEVQVSGGAAAGVAKSTEYIGMISRGDGRAQIRMMIVDWLKMIAPESPGGLCSSPNHGIGVEVRMSSQYKSDPRAILAHAWCLKWYNKCAICTQNEGPRPSSFDANLIPEV